MSDVQPQDGHFNDKTLGVSPDLAPYPVLDQGRRWLPSIVWTIPLLAAVLGIFLIIEDYQQRGPIITVSFLTAEGIEPKKTKVKFKSIDIGEVRKVSLSPQRDRALVQIELVREAAPFAVEDSRFWVVRPRLTGTSVSGLGTLVSGAYISVDGGTSHTVQTMFTGLEDPPLISSDSPGRQFVLSADDTGSLETGSPVYFRKVEVGSVVTVALQPEGNKVDVTIFVKAPYDRFVTTQTRFWNASGLNLSLGTEGFKIQTPSLASLLVGGIAFETPVTTQPPAPQKQADNGTRFLLSSSRMEALRPPDGPGETAVLRFAQSVRGLMIGDPVDLHGLEIGTVHSIDYTYRPFSDTVSAVVTISLYPERLSIESDKPLSLDTPEKKHVFLTQMIDSGLHGQLRTSNFLTGQLYIALDFFPDTKPDRTLLHQTLTEIPTVSGGFQELEEQVSGLLKKLNALPLDSLETNLNDTLKNLGELLGTLNLLARHAQEVLLPESTQTLSSLRQAINDVTALLADDSPLHQDARRVLQSLSTATLMFKSFFEQLDSNPESLLRGRQENTP